MGLDRLGVIGAVFELIKNSSGALGERLTKLFLLDENGQRPVMAAYPLLQADPACRDLVLFHEYFHGDNGRGVGASHQTGWSGLIALLLQPRVLTDVANVPAAPPTEAEAETMTP